MSNIYTVHSAHRTHVAVQAKTAGGLEVEGRMRALVVELVPDAEHQRTLTWVEHNPTDETVALFAEGSKVEMIGFRAVKEGK